MDNEDVEEEQKQDQKQMKKESDKNKQALNKMNAYVEDAEISSGAGAQELTQMKKKAVIKQAQILDKDIELMMKEFSLSKQESHNILKKHAGNLKEALIYILNH